MAAHLGHEHGAAPPLNLNMRNGTRVKTVLTEIGPVEIQVSRDRDGSFTPVIVPKRKRRLDGIDQIVLSLSARGLTTGEIAAHFDEVYTVTASATPAGSIATPSSRPSSRCTPPPQRPRPPTGSPTSPKRGAAATRRSSGCGRTRGPRTRLFLEYDVEIRRVICTTNAIESINARYRRAVNARGHFPNEAAAMKCLYLTTRSLDPTGHGKARWVVRWKPALNAFAITFAGRFERTTH